MQYNFHNTITGICDVQLLDSQGNCKLHNISHNTLCKYFLTAMRSADSDTLYMCVGTGEGTPSYSDTRLFNSLTYVQVDSRQFSREAPNIAKCVITATFPASTIDVGNLTEFGLRLTSQDLITHGLFLDSEGNPIIIEKTAADTLIITYTLTLTMTAPTGWHFGNTSNNRRHLPLILLGNMLGVLYRDGRELTNGMVRFAKGNVFSPRDPFSSISPTTFVTSWDANAGSVTFQQSLRLTSTDFGAGYFKRLYWAFWEDYGADNYTHLEVNLYLDLEEVFSPESIEGLSVGIGDGATTAFRPPLSYWKANTEVIYLNGIAQERNVDYTCLNWNNVDRFPELEVDWDNCVETYSPATQNKGDILVLNPLGYAYSACPKDTEEEHIGPYARDQYATINYAVYFYAGDILHWDFGNIIQISQLYFSLSSTYGTFQYSLDNEEWTNLSPGTYTTPVTLRYLRWTCIRDAEVSTAISEGTNLQMYIKQYHDTDNSIIFTSPPAANDVITMDCVCDKIYKAADQALEISVDFVMSFSGGDY